MSARRRRRAHNEREGDSHGGEERWAVSYMDMVTVLMALFVVLFSMSTVDQKKYEQLRASLADGFGVEDLKEEIDLSEGVVVPPDKIEEDGQDFTDVEMAALLEVEALNQMRQQMQEGLEQEGLGDSAEFTIDERGLTVRLVSSDTFFATGEATLTKRATRVLNVVGPVLAVSPYEISVEGHADYRATSGYRYPTNWELSTARSTTVLRRLVETSDVPDTRIGAVGYGSARPMAEGKSKDALAKNRRVDVVVLSDQPEVVRELLPEAAAELEQGGDEADGDEPEQDDDGH